MSRKKSHRRGGQKFLAKFPAPDIIPTCRLARTNFCRKSNLTSRRSGGFFDPSKLKSEIAEITKQSESETLWDNPDAARATLQKKSTLEKSLADLESLGADYKNLSELFALAPDDSDVRKEIEKLAARARGAKTITLFSQTADGADAFLFIQAGAGGTEAQDWAGMLARMYARWAERHGFSIETVDEHAGDTAGLKSITYKIGGLRAYGWLRNEIGIHRLVRISPFNAQGKRQTSFASVAVSPDVDDSVKIDISDKDLRVDTYRSSGAGGQHVNKTDSAIRITHIPTGTVVTCQNERSQFQNKDMAMKMLRSKLYELEMRKRQEQENAALAAQKKIEWGSQIRNYVLQPYQLVKDLRTGAERTDPDAVLDGDLDDFMLGLLSNEPHSKRA
ncbi:MAG: peptide chain release factor 2 [Rickettsiales bacterium]|nr:peptide chain release factor 2 [Rickettsiales bacterium]